MTEVYLSRIGVALGEPVPIAELPEVVAAGSAANLEKEGLSRCLVSDRAPWELAIEAARRTLGEPPSNVDAVVYVYDSYPDDPAPLRVLEATGLAQIPFYGAGMAGCGNLSTALQAARCLVLAGVARTVLVITADACPPGRRLMGANLSVLSDGAASCLVSAEPGEGAFRLLDVRTAVEASLHALALDSQTLPVLKATAFGIRRMGTALFDAGGFSGSEVAHLITHNYGGSAVRIMASAIGVPADRIWCPTAADIGHCFAADALINLAALGESGALRSGDRLLALMTGTAVWGCAYLQTA
ncbi:MAG TPA: 3-oxoacyl-[acyl-carrier-protein] synthase III C-terminal domain-containing protein [Candidatus Limnocylindrales bacterium]|nr:3-oxoacyl-[acyl-carrier-protein] synthase III C-terminal domain-containing protein [Candidatus Limnocylindrales bacterium]